MQAASKVAQSWPQLQQQQYGEAWDAESTSSQSDLQCEIQKQTSTAMAHQTGDGAVAWHQIKNQASRKIARAKHGDRGALRYSGSAGSSNTAMYMETVVWQWVMSLSDTPSHHTWRGWEPCSVAQALL